MTQKEKMQESSALYSGLVRITWKTFSKQSLNVTAPASEILLNLILSGEE